MTPCALLAFQIRSKANLESAEPQLGAALSPALDPRHRAPSPAPIASQFWPDGRRERSFPAQHSALRAAAASCQRCFLCLSFLSTPHFPAAAILEPGLGGGRRNKGGSSTAGILIPLSHHMAGPAINIRLHNTKRSRLAPAGHSPSLRRGKGRRGTALPRAPQGFGTANTLTHKPPDGPPLSAGDSDSVGNIRAKEASPRGWGKKKKKSLKFSPAVLSGRTPAGVALKRRN